MTTYEPEQRIKLFFPKGGGTLRPEQAEVDVKLVSHGSIVLGNARPRR
jgi:hypothetical protein